MAKPKPITRLGPGGGVVADQSDPLTSEEVFNCAKLLGQSDQEARETQSLFQYGQLSADDIKELYDMRKDLKATEKVAEYLQRRREKPLQFSVSPASVNPRDPTRIKQKVAIRDPMTGIRERLPFEPEGSDGEN